MNLRSTKTITQRWRARAKTSLIIGVTITLVGFAVLLMSIYLARGTLDVVRVAGSLSMLAIICGVVMGGVSLLALKGRSVEEAYSLGFDLGYEKGVRTGKRELLAMCPLDKPTCTLKRVDVAQLDPEYVTAAIEEDDARRRA